MKRVPGSVACALAWGEMIAKHVGTWGRGNDHPRRAWRLERDVKKFDRKWSIDKRDPPGKTP